MLGVLYSSDSTDFTDANQFISVHLGQSLTMHPRALVTTSYHHLFKQTKQQGLWRTDGKMLC